MKELIKTFLLVGLTISAIILTGAVFKTEEMTPPVQPNEFDTADLIEYIKPQNYVFSFGDLFIKLYDDKYDGHSIKEAYEATFQAFIGSAKEFNRAEISERIWQEQVSRKSLTIHYPFDIKLSDLIEINHYSVETEQDLYVTSVLFVLTKKDAIYIYDDVNDKYYRLTGEVTPIWIDDIYHLVDSERPKDSFYKTIESRYNFTNIALRKYNLTDANALLTPINSNITFPIYNVSMEASLGLSNDVLEDYAKNIFGDDLSFVKKSVTSDQSIIYMYGYGDKVFKINGDGSLEYLVKTENQGSGDPIDFIEGFAKSVDQINKMGISIKSYYLADYYYMPQTGETVYLFNYHRDGIAYLTDQTLSGNSIEVRFVNDTLAKLEKHARIVTGIDLDTIQEPVSFESILLKNQLKLELQYKEDRPNTFVDESDIFQMCIQEMSQFEVMYYVKDHQLRPVWKVRIALTDYLFDLTTGEIISD